MPERSRGGDAVSRPWGRPIGRPEVVHVGSACRDVAPDDPRGWRLGGGVTYAALTTARIGLRTCAIVGLDDEASGASELDLLRGAGVDLLTVPLVHGPVYRNVETPAGRVQTCFDPGMPLPVPTIPERWLAAPAWTMAPVADEVRDAWAAIPPASSFVAVAWQGLLRELAPMTRVTRRPPRPSALLRRADLVGVSDQDVDPGTTLESLAALLHPGSRLLVTQGRAGGLLAAVDGAGIDEILRYRAVPTSGEVDPTGAGDAFLAALVATFIRSTLGRPRSRRGDLDCRFAAAIGSLVVEAPGLLGVPDRPAVARRLAQGVPGPAVRPSHAERVDSTEPE
jgi:sugar/nucleoside kinase (ribokinase family)